jgi:hypothetical protein
MIKGKTPEEIRRLFNIVNDFTPEEEVCACFSLSLRSQAETLLIIGTNQKGERKCRC